MSKTVGFRYEALLKESFINNLERQFSIFKSSRLISYEESNCSQGRADLVLARVTDDWDQLFFEGAHLYQNPTCSRLLANLKPTAVRSESALKEKTGVSYPTLKSWLKKLSSIGLIEEVGNRGYKLGPKFFLPEAEIFSYEFKLTNWKRALYQATRYRSFSHRVFVVMPSHTIGPALEQLDIFKRYNVGIMSHDSTGKTKTIFAPRKSNPISRDHLVRAIGMLALPNS